METKGSKREREKKRGVVRDVEDGKGQENL